MTPWYTITPMDRTDWSHDPRDFADRIRQRWPSAECSVDDGEYGPELDVMLRHPSDPQRGIGVSLDVNGLYVVIDPADEPGMVADFTAWYLRQIPVFVPEVRLITEDYAVSMALEGTTTGEDVLSFLASLGRTDGGPACPMLPA